MVSSLDTGGKGVAKVAIPAMKDKATVCPTSVSCLITIIHTLNKASSRMTGILMLLRLP